jgi:hypothetical protein
VIRWLVVAACVVPRLAVLLHERDSITGDFAEKSDTFAQMLVQHGTFGMVPGAPSAYTQPLYAWFLVPVYWIFGRHWWSIGLAQIAVAVAVALLVLAIARRYVSTWWAGGAAVATTLHPYLVWHDVHVNREIVDQLCAAALVLLTLRVADRVSRRNAALLGAVAGLAMLGNTRLILIPLLCAVYLAFRRVPWPAVALVLAAAGLVVTPWLVRNQVSVGCFTLTTDGRAFWKANNDQTYDLLSAHKWIDDIRRDSPRPPAPAHLTPEEANGIWLNTGKALRPNECLAMDFYEERALDYIRDHPGEKLKLAALSEQLLWQPNVIETASGTSGGFAKQVVEPAYMIALYAGAAIGLFAAPPAFLALALALFAYNSLWAALFVGATRYRVAFDFLLAILAVCRSRR